QPADRRVLWIRRGIRSRRRAAPRVRVHRRRPHRRWFRSMEELRSAHRGTARRLSLRAAVPTGARPGHDSGGPDLMRVRTTRVFFVSDTAAAPAASVLHHLLAVPTPIRRGTGLLPTRRHRTPAPDTPPRAVDEVQRAVVAEAAA